MWWAWLLGVQRSGGGGSAVWHETHFMGGTLSPLLKGWMLTLSVRENCPSVRWVEPMSTALPDTFELGLRRGCRGGGVIRPFPCAARHVARTGRVARGAPQHAAPEHDPAGTHLTKKCTAGVPETLWLRRVMSLPRCVDTASPPLPVSASKLAGDTNTASSYAIVRSMRPGLKVISSAMAAGRREQEN